MTLPVLVNDDTVTGPPFTRVNSVGLKPTAFRLFPTSATPVTWNPTTTGPAEIVFSVTAASARPSESATSFLKAVVKLSLIEDTKAKSMPRVTEALEPSNFPVGVSIDLQLNPSPLKPVLHWHDDFPGRPMVHFALTEHFPFASSHGFSLVQTLPSPKNPDLHVQLLKPGAKYTQTAFSPHLLAFLPSLQLSTGVHALAFEPVGVKCFLHVQVCLPGPV